MSKKIIAIPSLGESTEVEVIEVIPRAVESLLSSMAQKYEKGIRLQGQSSQQQMAEE